MLIACITLTHAENPLDSIEERKEVEYKTMPLAQPIPESRPRRARMLPLFLFFVCLPSLFASGYSSGVVTTPQGGFVSSGSLFENLPGTTLPGDVGAWEVQGLLGFTATQDGTLSVTYDYYNASAGGMTAGPSYGLFLSVEDYFWSNDPNIALQSLTVTSTISRCFTINAFPCGPSNPDPNAFLWSASTSFATAGEKLGTASAPLQVLGFSSTGAQIPISDTFAFEQTSTMVFSGVTTGDVIDIDLPDTTQDDPTPEPATLSMAGLAVAGCALLKRRRRARG